MANPEIYADTYWSHKGKHEYLVEQLGKLIAMEGMVENQDKHPALEKFRIASNAYYDLYNNGGGNMAEEFESIFGFEGPCTVNESEYSLNRIDTDEEWWTKENVQRVEDAMNEIILAAAREQAEDLTTTYRKALETISSLWPEPPNCAKVAPDHVGPNDGRLRADLLKEALLIARKALGKTCGA